MKIIICGDSHIGAVYGLGKPNGKGGNTRVDDYEKTLMHIVDYAISSNADCFIQTGDAFDIRNPTAEHIIVMNKALKKLSMANITSAIIMGNHDYKRAGEAFTSSISTLAAKDYPNVKIVIEPQVLRLLDRRNKGVSIVLVPYRDRRMYGGKTAEEDSIAYENQVSDIIDKCDVGAPIVAVGHNFFYENSYYDFGGSEILTRVSCFNKCDMVAMGHYHQFKVLSKKSPIAFYTGSMEKINFGDKNIDKFFIEYSTDDKKVKVIKCPTRKLLDITFDISLSDYSNIHENIKRELDQFDFTDKIVRLQVTVSDTVISGVKKTDLEKILYSRGSFFVSKVTIEPVYKRLVRNTAILNEHSDYLKFKAYVNSQYLDNETKEEILAEAIKIIN